MKNFGKFPNIDICRSKDFSKILPFRALNVRKLPNKSPENISLAMPCSYVNSRLSKNILLNKWVGFGRSFAISCFHVDIVYTFGFELNAGRHFAPLFIRSSALRWSLEDTCVVCGHPIRLASVRIQKLSGHPICLASVSKQKLSGARLSTLEHYC